MKLATGTSNLLLAASAAIGAIGGAQERPAADGATFAPRAMVVSSSHIAAAAGTEVMKAGGNAIDAAVATGFALAVAYPEAGNIGGGGYMVIRMADGRAAALDYREMAPRSSFRDMFVDSAGKLTNYSVAGRSASGVPGAVAGLLAAHRRFGALPLAKVMAPAIRLAEEGLTVDSALSRSLDGKAAVLKEFAGSRLFFPGGKALAPGARLVQPELAATLRRIEREGEGGFYKGKTAAAIVAEMSRGCPAGVSARARASHGCGLITGADLAAYKPVWRTPLNTSFRGYTLLSMPPSSSGGVTVGESLNILDGFPRLPAFGTAEYIHLVASAFQRAFIDRNELLGDPAFVKVPIARLTSVEHAAMLRATIGKDKATPTPSLPPAVREGMETTHYSVVDAAGNAVSTTTTLNGLYGSGVYVDGGGFFLNNEMDDFASQPGQQNMFGLV
ncbi:MAG: gamma-glutamyltransferase family protein, partial [Gemmatimonadaceae bacterium]